MDASDNHIVKEDEEAVRQSTRNDSINSATLLANTVENEIKPKKGKKARGLHLPVRAFKSREDRDPEKVNEGLKVS